jgi:hypothetical protein
VARLVFAAVDERVGDQRESGDRARRRAARLTIAAYHEQQLRLLLERIRDGFARLDADEIDVFELDDLIHSTSGPRASCGGFGGSSGSDWLGATRSLEFLRQKGEELPDWWAAGEPRRRG